MTARSPILQKLLRLMAALSLLGWSAHARSEISVDGRFYVVPGNFLDTPHAEIGPTFSDALPWGTRVELRSGFGGVEFNEIGEVVDTFAWRDGLATTATAVSPYTWTAWVSHPLLSSHGSRLFQKFQFFWHVILPDGREYDVRGSYSTTGHYEVDLPDPHSVPSINRDHADFINLDVRAVD